MKKEIIKYPYNSRVGDETKIFLSDKISKQFMNIFCKNGNIFCVIKSEITDKKKKL